MGFRARVTLVFSAHVARWLWTADLNLTVKRESSCLVCAESWLFSTRLCSYTKTTKMEDFYVSDHKIDMKIKIKYIYNTQVT